MKYAVIKSIYRKTDRGIIAVLLIAMVTGCVDTSYYSPESRNATSSSPVTQSNIFKGISKAADLKPEWLTNQLLAIHDKNKGPLYDSYLLSQHLASIQSNLSMYGEVEVSGIFRPPFADVLCVEHYVKDRYFKSAIMPLQGDSVILDGVKIPKHAYRILPSEYTTLTAYNGSVISSKTDDATIKPKEISPEQVSRSLAVVLDVLSKPGSGSKLGTFETEQILKDYAQPLQNEITKNGIAIISEMVINGHSVWIQSRNYIHEDRKEHFCMQVFVDYPDVPVCAVIWDKAGEGAPIVTNYIKDSNGSVTAEVITCPPIETN